MSKATVEKLSLRLVEHVARHNLPQIDVVMHGGEPLLFGKERLHHFCETLRNSLGSKLKLKLQTNGVLLDEGWVDLLSKHGVVVGVSIDGSKEWNDRQRVYASGRSSYEGTRRGLSLLQVAEKTRNLKFGGTISVINPDQSASEFFQFMTDEIGVRSFNVLLPDADHETYSSYYKWPLPVFSRFLTELFDIWLEQADTCSIRFFENLVRRIVGQSSQSESIGAFGAPSVIIETDGSIEPHDVARMNSKERPPKVTIEENPIDAIWEHSVFQKLNKSRPQECADCPAYDVCRGGFVAHRWSNAKGYDNPSVYCGVLFDLISHAHFRLAINH